MGKPSDLESLRAIFKDQRQHIAIGKITKLGLADDRSCLRVQVQILDASVEEDREVVAMMGWDDVGPDCGVVRFPEVNDLVLLAFVDGDAEQCYVIKRLTSKEEKIPLKAADGHTVVQSLSGKKLYLGSDTRVLIGTGDDATENLVLGQQLKTLLSNILGAIASHTHVSNAPGIPTGPPANAATFSGYQSSPVNDGAILSDRAFTEK